MNNLLLTAAEAMDTFAGLPEFMWDGIFKLGITTLGGVIVAAFTTLYLKQKEEITRISGVLAQRRLDIYRELLLFCDRIGQKVLMPGDLGFAILEVLKTIEFSLPWGDSCEYSKVFETKENFESFYADLEKIILRDKLFLDDESIKHLYYMQSFFAIINRLYIGIEENARDSGKYYPKQLESAQAGFLKAVGAAADEEISEMCEELESIFVAHISKLKLERRKKAYLRYEFFMDRDGYVMQKLAESILNQKEKMLVLQMFYIEAATRKL